MRRFLVGHLPILFRTSERDLARASSALCALPSTVSHASSCIRNFGSEQRPSPVLAGVCAQGLARLPGREWPKLTPTCGWALNSYSCFPFFVTLTELCLSYPDEIC